MKRHSEQMAEHAVRMLLKTLERNFADTGVILDEFEATHDEAESEDNAAYRALVAGYFALEEAIERINNKISKTMDRRKIYGLLCEVIKESELGKRECLKEDFDERQLCDHAWENLENLVDEISKVITAENRAMVKRRAAYLAAVQIYPVDCTFDNFPESDDVRREGGISNI